MDHRETSHTLSSRERVAVAAVFVIAVVVAAVVVARIGAPPGDVVGSLEERPAVGAHVPRPVTIVDAYDVALEWARTWHPDAWPILVSMQVEFPPESALATPQPDQGFILFTFAGPKEGDEWPRLTLAIGRQSGLIYHEEELTSSVEPPGSIADLVTGVPVGGEQAFRVADEVVGEGYREGCAPTRRQVQVVLDATDRQAPAWVVVYYDLRERGTNDIVVRIDAGTGRTSTETRDDTACEMD